jgi:SAM-dependent methyltransferase
MRANTRRTARFAFDRVVDAYDLGRPRFGDDTIARLTDMATLPAGATVLEIGAGTGQLTAGLLRAKLAVTALEPSPGLAERLHVNLGANPHLEIRVETFEDFDPIAKYPALFAANAFHWVDPAVSYAKAQTLLQAEGALCLLWNFPILADAALQRRLNKIVFSDDLADLRREPTGYAGQLASLLEDGRQELKAQFAGEVQWEIHTRRRSLSIDRYVDLLNSYANAADARDSLALGVASVCGTLEGVEIDDHEYLCVAKKH